MRRREFITLLGGAAVTWPLTALAQQGERVRRIGVLMGWPESDSDAQAHIAAFREGLQKLGWTEGRNTQIDIRWATPDDAESMRGFAKELVALQPDLLLSSTTPTTSALLQQTRTIPIVFAIVGDPIGSGFVASFPRPGGNVTGFNVSEPTVSLRACTCACRRAGGGGGWWRARGEGIGRFQRINPLQNKIAQRNLLEQFHPFASQRRMLPGSRCCSTPHRRHMRTSTQAKWWSHRDAG
jgi:hypothetical protein